jgi:hypothetical protein
MSKRRAILAYLVLAATGILLVLLSDELAGKFSVFVRRSILGLVLLVGACAGIALLKPQFIEPLDEASWPIIKTNGKTKYVLRGTAKGFFFGLIVTTIALARDYFRADSLTDNLGLYASLVLVSSFVFFSTATKTWMLSEKRAGSHGLNKTSHPKTMV